MTEFYHSEKELKKRRLFFRLKLYVSSGSIILFLLFLTFFLQSPLFQLKVIEIEGLKSIAREEFVNNLNTAYSANFLSAILGPKNFLLWLKDVNYRHPAILKMSINRDFWNQKIVFNIEEREPAGIWCFPIAELELVENCYWFDKEGVLFNESPSTAGYLIYKIQDSVVKDGLIPSRFKTVAAVLDIFKNKNVPIRIVNINDKSQELIVETQQGTEITISLRFDPTATLISALDTIVKKIGFKNIQYLDLTVENRIYYK